MKKVILLTSMMYLVMMGVASGQNVDTIVVELTGTTKMVLTIGDRGDVQQLRRYDFQGLLDDILDNIENNDTLNGREAEDSNIEDNDADEMETEDIDDQDEMDEEDDEHDEEDEMDEDDNGDDEDEDYNMDENDDDDDHEWSRDDCSSHTKFNFDFGINNFLEDARFPDDHNALYSVRPWGSWYVGINSILHTDVSRQFFIEWGLGVSWYNFKFQKDNILVTKGENGVNFSEDPRDLNFDLSKLSATYLNASVIPMFTTGRNHSHRRWWHNDDDSFRIGVGPYIGYRIESHSKLVYIDDGDREVEKERDNFYLNNFRYGVRLQMGIESLDFFAAYDLNTLFVKDQGPKLNAFTIGLVF